MSAYCIQCKKEMFCDKIGVFAAFQERHHCYAGDVYKCPQCLSSVLIVSPETKPTYIEHPEKVQKELFIDIQE